MRISLSLPKDLPAQETNGRRSVLVPMLGKNVVELTAGEAEWFREQIDSILPPVFIELSFPNGTKSVWTLQEDLECLLKPKTLTAS